MISGAIPITVGSQLSWSLIIAIIMNNNMDKTRCPTVAFNSVCVSEAKSYL